MERYNHLNSYLKDKFGTRTLKICIDGNFTCPNRDGKKGFGGCIFCGERGAGENIKGILTETLKSIENQINLFLNSYRGERADKFIVYFQAFSNTYDSIENLEILYKKALSCSEKIIGIEIATRPDLISEDVAKLLSKFKEKYYVCVELGLQTANDEIGEILNRHYTTADYINACNILNKYSIDFVTHMMIGLPNEKEEDIYRTVDVINESGAKGIKIHNTFVLKNTVLAKMYESGEYLPISLDYYVNMVGEVIGHLRKDIIIHRITGDPPKDQMLAPEYSLHKKIMLNKVNKNLEEKDIYQGKYYRRGI